MASSGLGAKDVLLYWAVLKVQYTIHDELKTALFHLLYPCFVVYCKNNDTVAQANIVIFIVMVIFFLSLTLQPTWFLYFICTVFTERSAAPQTTLWRGPWPRFEPGSGGSLFTYFSLFTPTQTLFNNPYLFNLKSTFFKANIFLLIFFVDAWSYRRQVAWILSCDLLKQS